MLAWLYLFDAVAASMAGEGITVPHAFGWREPDARTGTMRIVWVPGDDRAAGDIGAARFTGEGGTLGTFNELFTIYIEAVDLPNAENERAQYTATRLLFDTFWRHVHQSAHGVFQTVSIEWVTDKQERRYGATMRVVLSLQAALPDASCQTTATILDGLRALIASSSLDVTETVASHTFAPMAPQPIDVPVTT